MKNNKGSSEYKSAKLLLEVIQKEYDNDINKLSELYSRTGIFIAVIAAYLGFIFSNNDYFTFFRTSTIQSVGCIENIVLNFTYASASILTFLSGYNFFSVLLTSQYVRLDSAKGFDENTAKNDENINAFYLMQRYSEVVLLNKPVVDKKTRHYKYGAIFLGMSILFFSIYLGYLKFIGL